MAELKQTILSACKQGDEYAWRTLFSAYYPLSKWCVVHTLYNIDDYTVSSIAQDAMVVLCQNIQKIDDEAYLKRFVLRVTKNKCIDYIRKNQTLFEEVPEDIPESTDTQISDDVIDALHQAVNELQEPCFSIVRSRFLDGLSYRELAQKIQVDVSQIGVRISRCLNFLKGVLARKNISLENAQ